ncbi:hypothetical protein, partial [Staphylococcus hominis]|uniref:hypothetical protein n=1 Tax=Staphylococcus hominis TaxID=1290 RepID=UPI0011A18FEA
MSGRDNRSRELLIKGRTRRGIMIGGKAIKICGSGIMIECKDLGSIGEIRGIMSGRRIVGMIMNGVRRSVMKLLRNSRVRKSV